MLSILVIDKEKFLARRISVFLRARAAPPVEILHLTTWPRDVLMRSIAIVIARVRTNDEGEALQQIGGMRAAALELPIVVSVAEPSSSLLNGILLQRCLVLADPFGDRELSTLVELAECRAIGLPRFPTLSTRQEQILQMAVEGASRKDMASHLNVSEHTIKWHARRLLDQTGDRNLRELAIRLLRKNVEMDGPAR